MAEVCPQVDEHRHVSHHVKRDRGERYGLDGRGVWVPIVGCPRPKGCKRDLHDAREEVQRRVNTHFAQARENFLQIGADTVERQRKGEHHKVARDGLNVLHREGADVVERDEWDGEHGEIEREGYEQEHNLRRAVRDGRYDALHVAFRLHFRKLGEHGGRDGDGQEGVGQRVPQTGVCEDRGAVDGKTIGGRIHDRHGRERDDHHEKRRPADGEGVAKRRVVKVDVGAQADAVSLERGKLDCHLHEDAERVADGDDVERGVGVYGRDRGVHEEGRDDDDVVRHRGD